MSITTLLILPNYQSFLLVTIFVLYKATKQYLVHLFHREKFYLISVVLLRMCIKTASGEFIVSQKNGGFTAEALDADSATRWEY